MAGLLTVLRVNSFMRVQKMPKAKNRLVQFTTLPLKVKSCSYIRLRRSRLLRSHLEFGLAVSILPSPMTCRYLMYHRCVFRPYRPMPLRHCTLALLRVDLLMIRAKEGFRLTTWVAEI